MTKMTKALAALQRGATWVRATLDPHDIDPYEREPIYYGALLRPVLRDQPRDAGERGARSVTTARNHVRYPLD